MHDISELDRRGIPGLAIATEEFRDAVQAQAKTLGFTPAVLFVPHPIQNRSAGELSDLAVQVARTIVASGWQIES